MGQKFSWGPNRNGFPPLKDVWSQHLEDSNGGKGEVIQVNGGYLSG